MHSLSKDDIRFSLIPFYHMLPRDHKGRIGWLECVASTRTILSPDGWEYAIISIRQDDAESLINDTKSNVPRMRQWMAYWYGGSPTETALFPKPHPDEIVESRFKFHLGEQLDRCEIQLKIQRGHYLLAQGKTGIDPLSVATWPRSIIETEE